MIRIGMMLECKIAYGIKHDPEEFWDPDESSIKHVNVQFKKC